MKKKNFWKTLTFIFLVIITANLFLDIAVFSEDTVKSVYSYMTTVLGIGLIWGIYYTIKSLASISNNK